MTIEKETDPTTAKDDMCDAPSSSTSGLDGSAVVGTETIIGAEAKEAAANAPPAVTGLGKVRRSVAAGTKNRPGYIFNATEEATVDVGMLGIVTDGAVGGGSSSPGRYFGTCPQGCVDCRDCRIYGTAVSCPDGSHPDVPCQVQYDDDDDDGGADTSSTSSGDCAGSTTSSMASSEEEDRASLPRCFQLAGFNESVPTIVSNDSVVDCHARNCSGAKEAASSAA